MAGEIGVRLLGELQTTQLRELCVLLDNDLSSHNILCIPAIDRILSRIWATPPPQVTQLAPSRTRAKHKPVIEITSMSVSCGKTHILYYTTVLCTFPSFYGRVPLHGKSAAVVIFDNDGRFDVCRLYSIMRQHICNCHRETESAISEPDADAIAKSALQHVHVYRPQSSSSMIEMLKGLSGYLLQSVGHNSNQRCLDAILVDGLSAFYWQDKLASQELGAPVYQEIYETIVEHLRQASAKFGAFIMATNWGLQHVESARPLPGGLGAIHSSTSPFGPVLAEAAELPAFRSHLTPAWAKFVDLKLVVMRDVIVPFRRGISIVEVLQGKEAREEEVKSSFTGWADVRGLSLNLQESLDTKDRMFQFNISKDGITFTN